MLNKEEMKDAILYGPYKNALGTWTIDLKPEYITSYGTHYIERKTKKECLWELENEVSLDAPDKEFNSLNESKDILLEVSRNELLARGKSQTITRYNKAPAYRGFNIVDIDTTSILTTNRLRVTCKVGDYWDTIEMQDILFWIQFEAEKNANNQINTKAINNAIMQSIDGMDIKVDCTCPDWIYRFAYRATKYDYKYGKPENRPANITNPGEYGSLCFTGDTLVLTENGLIPIKEIKVGDKVFTHKGKLKEVEFTSNHYEKNLIEAKIGTEIIKCTKNHPFYILDKENKVVWKDLTKVLGKTEYTLTPQLQLEEYTVLPKGYAFMLGLFLSDRHIDIRPQKNNKLYPNQLTLALDKQYKQFYEDKMKELGFRYRFKEKTYRYDTHCINLQIYDKDLKKFIIENGGYTYKDQHSKFLTSRCFNWSKHDKLDLINGFFWGDGQFGVTENKDGYLQYILYNSNKDIMQKLYILIRSFTYARIFSMTKKSFYSKSMKKIITPCKYYLICLRGEHIDNILQEDCKSVKTENSYKQPISSYKKSYEIIDNLKYFKTNINKSQIKEIEGDIVYNLQVKDDESYLITRELYAVHNCKHLLSLLGNKKWLQQVTGTVMDYCEKRIDDINQYLRVKEGEELTLPNELARANAKKGFYSKLFKDKEDTEDVENDLSDDETDKTNKEEPIKGSETNLITKKDDENSEVEDKKD